MVGIFKANNPLNAFLLFIYGLLLKFSFFRDVHLPVIQKTDGIFFRELIIWLNKAGTGWPYIYPVLTYLLLFTQAVTLNKLLNNQRLIQRSTYLPAMSYLLITSLFPEWNILTSTLIVNTIMIWVCARMNNLYNTSNPKTVLFNIGTVIGVCSLFYFPSLAFALLIVFALILTRPFNLAEWLIALVGIATPYYFLFVWLFLSDNLKNYELPAFIIAYPKFQQNYWSLGAIALILIAFLTGAYFVDVNFRRQVVQVRNSWSLILFYLVATAFIPFINYAHTFEYWILTAVPLSAFIACAFIYPAKKWFPVLLHWLMVALVIATSYFIT
ncbi:MAG: DUF6427 family protein [Ginsengibacter sp.]